MVISEKIIESWPEWRKLLIEYVASLFLLVFGIILAIDISAGKISCEPGFDYLVKRFSDVTLQTLPIASFLIVPCFIILWFYSSLIIWLRSNLKTSFLYYVWLVLQNFFFLKFSWYPAYKYLKCNYKLFDILQGTSFGKIHIILSLYLTFIILFLLSKNSRLVKRRIWSYTLFILLFLFAIYFLFITFISRYSSLILKVFF